MDMQATPILNTFVTLYNQTTSLVLFFSVKPQKSAQCMSILPGSVIGNMTLTSPRYMPPECGIHRIENEFTGICATKVEHGIAVTTLKRKLSGKHILVLFSQDPNRKQKP
jgi:hypothetical protein